MASRLCFFISGLQDKVFTALVFEEYCNVFTKINVILVKDFIMRNHYILKNLSPSNIFLLFAVFFIIAVFSFNCCSKEADDNMPVVNTTLRTE